MSKPRPVLARRLFWDVDFDKLDHEADAAFIIERVRSWSDIPDIRQARRYCGDDRVLAVLLESDEMPPVPLHFWSAIFNRPVTDFKSHVKGEGKNPHSLKREYFERPHEIHGLPPPPPDPILMRMS